MKKLLFALLLSSLTFVGFSQARAYKIFNDTVMLDTYSTNGSSLVIKNKTKDTLGFLYNTGNGFTIFKRALVKINDSTYLIGADTLHIHSAGGGGPATWGAITGTLSSQTDLQSALNALVAKTTTITINGTAQDLSTNRTWNVGTVTQTQLNDTATAIRSAFPAPGGGITSLTGDVTASGTGSVVATLARQLNPTAVKTTNYSATVNDFIPCDNSGGSFTVTLPTAPADKSIIGVKLVILGASNTITIAAAGSDVFNKAGGSTSLTITLANQSLILQYKASTGIWYVLSTDAPINAFQAALNGTGYVNFTGTTPSYFTPTQVTANLNLFTTSLQGLVPASGGGTTNFLRADGTWAAAGAGSGWGLTGNSGITNSNFTGTTNNSSYRIRTNNVERSYYDSLGHLWIGTNLYNPNPISGDPPHILNVINDSSTNQVFEISSYGSGATFQNNIHFNRYWGTAASPSAIGTGVDLVSMGGRGYGTTTLGQSSAAIQMISTQAFTDAAHGTKIVLSTTANNTVIRSTVATFDQDLSTTFTGLVTAPSYGIITGGTGSTSTLTLRGSGGSSATTGSDIIFNTNGTASPVEAMRIINSGNVGIGIALPTVKLDVEGGTNGSVGLILRNTTAGTAAQAQLNVFSDAGALSFQAFSSTWTTSGINIASGAKISASSGMTAGLMIATTAAAPITFAAGGTENWRIANTGQLSNTGATGTYMIDVNAAGGVIKMQRSTANTNSSVTNSAIYNKSSATIVDGYGGYLSFHNIGSSAVDNEVGGVGVVRSGADNSGALNFFTANAGVFTEKFRITPAGGFVVNQTNTPTGTTGAQTINNPSGSVNFAAAASTLVVTNALVTTSSKVFVQVEGTDATATEARVTKAAGSFTITLNSAATAETRVSFWVIN